MFVLTGRCSIGRPLSVAQQILDAPGCRGPVLPVFLWTARPFPACDLLPRHARGKLVLRDLKSVLGL